MRASVRVSERWDTSSLAAFASPFSQNPAARRGMRLATAEGKCTDGCCRRTPSSLEGCSGPCCCLALVYAATRGPVLLAPKALMVAAVRSDDAYYYFDLARTWVDQGIISTDGFQ